jgi:type IX secretion system PorP/SprF family membrane protein
MTSGTLSLGLAGGLFMVRNHWDDLVAIHPDDPGIPVTLDRFVYPDFSIGVNYQSNSFFAGISLPMFLTHRFNSDTHRFDLVNDYRNYNFHLQAGYLFRISTNWRILPSVMARYTPAAFPQVDMNAYVIYRNRIWAGLSYRTDHALIGLIMYQVNNQLSLAYSYDMGWGYSGRLLGGTHEIMLRYDFKYIIDVISPRFF